MSVLGYVKTLALASGAFTGGFMAVDARGLPLDFRYTDPVVPSRVQQLLYGKALDRHVRFDVLFKHLLDRLEPKPVVIFVDEEGLLSQSSPVPVALLAETRLQPLKEAAHLQTVSDTEFLLQIGETGAPLRFKLGKSDPALAEQIKEWLVESSKLGLDPVEPFQRIRGAVVELGMQSSRSAVGTPD